MKQIYKGKVVTLNVETVTLPNGATIELEMIRHPGAAVVVPMKDEQTVVLIHQYRYAAGGFIYEVPAGKLHPGEDPRDCADRELEEEIGYRAGRLAPLVSIFSAPGFTDEILHLFLATELVKTSQNLGHDEVLEVVDMPLEQAIELIAAGTIRDAKTIVGLQTVYLRQLRREGRAGG